MIDADYVTFGEAFDYLNKALFDGQLVDVMFTLVRKKNMLSHSLFERYDSRTGGKERISEIALNPDYFRVSSDMDILSNIAHEQVHLWQQLFGNPGRENYHNGEWADKMQEIGLTPTGNGEEGGPKTGQKMYHLIDKGGRFEIACGGFLAGGKKIEWQSLVAEEPEPKEKKKTKKFVYNCTNCLEVEVTSKTEVRVICGECDTELVLQEQPEE